MVTPNSGRLLTRFRPGQQNQLVFTFSFLQHGTSCHFSLAFLRPCLFRKPGQLKSCPKGDQFGQKHIEYCRHTVFSDKTDSRIPESQKKSVPESSKLFKGFRYVLSRRAVSDLPSLAAQLCQGKHTSTQRELPT